MKWVPFLNRRYREGIPKMENKRVRGWTSGAVPPLKKKKIEYPPPPPAQPTGRGSQPEELRYVSFASNYDKISLKAGFRKLTCQAKKRQLSCCTGGGKLREPPSVAGQPLNLSILNVTHDAQPNVAI